MKKRGRKKGALSSVKALLKKAEKIDASITKAQARVTRLTKQYEAVEEEIKAALA